MYLISCGFEGFGVWEEIREDFVGGAQSFCGSA